MDETTVTLSNALRRMRLMRGMTALQLAARSGISRSSISGIERGLNTNPTSDTIARLAEALSCSPQDLMPHVESAPNALPPLFPPRYQPMLLRQQHDVSIQAVMGMLYEHPNILDALSAICSLPPMHRKLYLNQLELWFTSLIDEVD